MLEAGTSEARSSAPGRRILSAQQERLWVAYHLDPKDPSQNLRSALRIRGPLDYAALERSLNALLARHEQLRATFREAQRRPLARIADDATIHIRRIDLRGISGPDLEAECAAVIVEEASRPFDLTQGPPIRAALSTLAEDEFVLVLTVHHIVCDAWSMDLLLRELSQLYDAAMTGRPATLADLSGCYADFAEAQLEALADPSGADRAAFWRRQLSGYRTSSLLPLQGERSSGSQMPSRRLPFAFAARLGPAVDGFARAQGLTAYMVLLTAFAALLHRISDAPDVVVASPVANREDEAWEGIVGYFVNLLPLRIPIAAQDTLAEILSRVRRTVLEAHEHQQVPLHKIAEAAQLRPSALLRILYQHVAAPTHRIESGGIVLEPRPIDLGKTRHDLSLTTYAEAGGLAGILEYSTDLLDLSTVERVQADLESVLERFIEDPTVRVADLVVSPDWVHATEERGREPAPPLASNALTSADPTSTEETLATIWRDTLKLDTLSPFDNFLDVGGDSLLAMQVIERVERELGARLAPADLFTQTLAQLAASCEKRRG